MIDLWTIVESLIPSGDSEQDVEARRALFDRMKEIAKSPVEVKSPSFSDLVNYSDADETYHAINHLIGKCVAAKFISVIQGNYEGEDERYDEEGLSTFDAHYELVQALATPLMECVAMGDEPPTEEQLNAARAIIAWNNWEEMKYALERVKEGISLIENVFGKEAS